MIRFLIYLIVTLLRLALANGICSYGCWARHRPQAQRLTVYAARVRAVLLLVGINARSFRCVSVVGVILYCGNCWKKRIKSPGRRRPRGLAAA